MNIPLNFKFNITKDTKKRLIILRKTSTEGLEHIILKLLAYLLFFNENLQIEIDAYQHYKPDLIKFDKKQTWKVIKWIDCGTIDTKKLLKISKHNRQAEICIFKFSLESAQSLKDKIIKKAQRISNIRYFIFDKGQINIIKGLLKSRNEIIILNNTNTNCLCLNFNNNNEHLQMKFDCF
ncbi:YaeQ family protein [Candidatus Parcubacteria bacterium]|nr:YaeQ family protein [Candidatus Parcubacteria bacterium]